MQKSTVHILLQPTKNLLIASAEDISEYEKKKQLWMDYSDYSVYDWLVGIINSPCFFTKF